MQSFSSTEHFDRILNRRFFVSGRFASEIEALYSCLPESDRESVWSGFANEAGHRIKPSKP